MAKKDEKSPIRFMSDDEFNAMKLKENKESFLDELISASSSKGKRFSVKNLRKENTKPVLDDEDDDEMKFQGLSEDFDLSFKPLSANDLYDDDAWETMIDKFNTISPIDDITTEDKMRYRRKSQGDKYDMMFDKERSMLNDVLSDLQSRSKIVNTSIKNMVGNKPSGGRGGISKTFTELVEAGNSLDTSKLQVIKALVDIKKTSIDLRIKEQKNFPDDEGMDTDTIADQFYKQITGAGAKMMRDNAMGNYSYSQSQYESSEDEGHSPQFNLSQPESMMNIHYDDSDKYEDSYEDVDRYGYIRNETRGVDIFLNRYDDGSLEFVALDEDGMRVDDYQLPDDILLDSMEIKPMSPYAYDSYGRKYKIIDVESTVGLDDLDDDKYDTISDDDKYDID